CKKAHFFLLSVATQASVELNLKFSFAAGITGDGTHPLDLREVLRRISYYVSVADALDCILVSKKFAYPIWRTIDYTMKRKSTKMIGEDDEVDLEEPESFMKYAHHCLCHQRTRVTFTLLSVRLPRLTS